MPERDRLLGTLLGAAVGDALGMPVDGLSHQNVRLYYKGIKAYRDDEKRRGLEAGQWTAHTQRLFTLTSALVAHPADPNAARTAFDTTLGAISLRRPEHLGETTAEATALGCAWARHAWGADEAMAWVAALFADRAAPARAAAYGHAFAVRVALVSALEPEDGRVVLEDIAEEIGAAETQFGADARLSTRLRDLAGHLDETPLDLQDRCNGTGAAADEAFPFAAAMFARNPLLVEATLLSAVNVGGAASAVGALVGALLGARNGWAAFPEAWRDGLEDVEIFHDEAAAFFEARRAPGER